MRIKIVTLIICRILLIACPAKAQLEVDSAKSVYFLNFNLASDIFRNSENLNDSILINSFFYDNLKQHTVYAPATGSPGSASFNFFHEGTFNKFFSDGFNQFLPYQLNPLKNFPLNNGVRRYTGVNYHLATKKEQHIFLKHEQQIKPWFVAGLDFGALSSPGDFSRTLNTNRNFDIYFGYEAPSKVYRTYTSFTSNRVLNQENGGISSDSVFENATSLDTRTLPINLPIALMKQRSRDFLVKQELNLTRLFDKADSAERKGTFTHGSLVLNHSFWLHRKSSLFTSQNADSGYFKNYYIDSIITYDSSFYNDMYQVALLEYTTLPSMTGRILKVGAGFEHQQVEYTTGKTDSIFKSGSIVFTTGLLSKQFDAALFYSKNISGDFNNGYRGRFYLNYTFGKFFNAAYIKLNAGKIPHAVKNSIYNSNHFRWNNDFELLEQYDFTAGVTLSKFKLNVEARTQTSKNIIFYREDFLPQTYGSFINVRCISISDVFTLGKFGIDTKIVLSESANDNVVPVPLISLFSAVYYQNRFFKNVLGFKAGVDISYFSEYYGYGYMPATGVFYLQQEKKIGNYPLAGVFINLNIKTAATLFIRLDHANAGIGERTYYGAYHYPLPGRTFKFGVRWDLTE